MASPPTGALIRKMERQPSVDVSTPPSRKPTMAPSDPAVAQRA
jgi:hypothetical protein